MKHVRDMIITHSHKPLQISNFVFANTENAFVHRYKRKVVVASQRECLDVHFQKNFL